MTAVAKSAYYQLMLIYQLCSFLVKKKLALVTYARSPLYVGLPRNISQKLKMVQNAAAGLLLGATFPSCNSVIVWVALAVNLFLCSIYCKVLVLIYKALCVLGPWRLADCLVIHISARPWRSSREALLQIPIIDETSLVSIWVRAFPIVAHKLWNALSGKPNWETSLPSFQGLAKTCFSSGLLLWGIDFIIGFINFYGMLF